MEKVCEFCTLLPPVIYCTADEAFLCLSCDAKVHYANALSNRHFRAFLCEACRKQPSCIQCLGHRMVLCQGCDRAFHGGCPQQGKRTISSYTGCPSAKHFGILWGIDVNELDNLLVEDHKTCSSCVSEDTSSTNLDRMGSTSSVIGSFPLGSPSTSASVITAESFVGSSSQRRKAPKRKYLNKKSSLIMQQIFELKRLQLSQGIDTPSVIRREGQLCASSTLGNNAEKHEELPHRYSDNLPGPIIELEKTETPDEELNGDSFWQCRSPTGNSEFWSQNLQELGVCEEFDSFGDFNMPNMDGAFGNFEELFAADEDVNWELLDDIDATCSSIGKDASGRMRENSSGRGKESLSASSTMQIDKPNPTGKHVHPIDKARVSSRSMDSLLSIQRPCSSSISVSHLGAGSTGSDYLGSRNSGTMGGGPSYAGGDAENKDSAVRRCKGIRTARSRRKEVELGPQKIKAEPHSRSTR